MAEFYTVVTDAGREAVAKATQAGEKVDITHFAVGDGGGSAVTPDESQTQLVNECWRGLVSTYKQDGTNIIIDTYIPADEESFTAREMGIFTADGVLFAVCNTPEMRKVLPSEGAVGDFAFGMKIDVSNLDTSYIEIHTNPMLDFVKNSEKGVAGGVATLDEFGNVEQLPELAFVKLSDKATSNDVKTGTDNTKWVTPSGLMSGLSLNAPRVVLLTSGSLKVSSHQININPTLPSNIFDYKTLILKFTITPRTFSLSGSYACDCHIRTQQYYDGDDVICSYNLFTGTPLNIPKVFQRECQLVSLGSSGQIEYVMSGKNANYNTILYVGVNNVMSLYAGYNPSGSSATFDVSYYIYGKESTK